MDDFSNRNDIPRFYCEYFESLLLFESEKQFNAFCSFNFKINFKCSSLIIDVNNYKDTAHIDEVR